MIPLKTGVVGVGHFGRYHALKVAQSPRMQLEGVCDSDRERAENVAREAGGVNVLSLARLIRVSKALIIASPADTHFAVAKRALEAGVHVLLEKPIASTLQEADMLIDIAEKNGCVLQIGHLLRYSAEYAAITKRIARPIYIEATRIAPFKLRGIDVSVVLDVMIHDIDLIISIVDAPVKSVEALGVAVASEHEDIVNARIHFINGCVATITASRISLKTERRMRLFSEEGYLSADFMGRTLTMIGRKSGLPLLGTGGLRREVVTWSDHDNLIAEHNAFASACLDGTPVIVDGGVGRRALQVALAVADSMIVSRKNLAKSGIITEKDKQIQ